MTSTSRNLCAVCGNGSLAPHPGHDFTSQADAEDFETWAASQPPDNYVYRMACGHEHDSSFRRTEGVFVQCSMHGRQRLVDGPFNG